MQINSELVFSLLLYTLIIPAHELLHYVSARNRVVRVKIKPYGVLMTLKGITLRDILLPQLITLVLLVLYLLTGRPAYFACSMSHVISSFLDFYAYIKFKLKKRSNQPKPV